MELSPHFWVTSLSETAIAVTVSVKFGVQTNIIVISNVGETSVSARKERIAWYLEYTRDAGRTRETREHRKPRVSPDECPLPYFSPTVETNIKIFLVYLAESCPVPVDKPRWSYCLSSQSVVFYLGFRKICVLRYKMVEPRSYVVGWNSIVRVKWVLKVLLVLTEVSTSWAEVIFNCIHLNFQPSRDSENPFRSGWRDVNHHPQSFSGLVSPRRSNSIQVRLLRVLGWAYIENVWSIFFD